MVRQYRWDARLYGREVSSLKELALDHVESRGEQMLPDQPLHARMVKFMNDLGRL